MCNNSVSHVSVRPLYDDCCETICINRSVCAAVSLLGSHICVIMHIAICLLFTNLMTMRRGGCKW